MPRKLRELRAELRQAGFRNRGGKGDHQNWEHPMVTKRVGLAGQDGDDAQPYQEKAVRDALGELARKQKEVQP
jgi:predicted RNA binding protein YcfA (HicA-like mRNA interferase family)